MGGNVLWKSWWTQNFGGSPADLAKYVLGINNMTAAWGMMLQAENKASLGHLADGSAMQQTSTAAAKLSDSLNVLDNSWL